MQKLLSFYLRDHTIRVRDVALELEDDLEGRRIVEGNEFTLRVGGHQCRGNEVHLVETAPPEQHERVGLADGERALPAGLVVLLTGSCAPITAGRGFLPDEFCRLRVEERLDAARRSPESCQWASN